MKRTPEKTPQQVADEFLDKINAESSDEDVVMEAISDMLRDRHFVRVDDILACLDVSKISIDDQIAFLSITNFARKKLPNRVSFYHRVVNDMKRRHKEDPNDGDLSDPEGLLSGLEPRKDDFSKPYEGCALLGIPGDPPKEERKKQIEDRPNPYTDSEDPIGDMIGNMAKLSSASIDREVVVSRVNYIAAMKKNERGVALRAFLDDCVFASLVADGYIRIIHAIIETQQKHREESALEWLEEQAGLVNTSMFGMQTFTDLASNLSEEDKKTFSKRIAELQQKFDEDVNKVLRDIKEKGMF